MAGKSAFDTEELKSLSSEVSSILKEKIGAKAHSDLLVECSKKATEKTTKRKQAEADLAVTDPQAAALLKRKKMEKKTEQRKRKLDTERPFRAIKRRQRESELLSYADGPLADEHRLHLLEAVFASCKGRERAQEFILLVELVGVMRTAIPRIVSAFDFYRWSHDEQIRPNGKRKAIFKLTAACALNAGNEERVLKLAVAMMPHLYREMAGKSAFDTEELKSLSSEVSSILKEKIGAKAHSDLLVECSKKATEKTTKRKQAEADLAVTDPQAAALLKRKKMEKKTEQRKRKLDTERPFRAIKRRQRESMRKKLDDADVELFEE
uniref:NOC3p domain-containing protein n=1 Tax=Panagrellus redivivus TaxID=6233 RepID=A0A7E4W8V1_PANRE